MTDNDMLNEYVKVRDEYQLRYLRLSKVNASLLLALKNLFNAESINTYLIKSKMNEYLDNEWEIDQCRNGILRMNENIYYCSKVGVITNGSN